MAFSQLFGRFSKYLVSPNQTRNIFVSASRNIREIIETKNGNVTTIEAIVKPQANTHLLFKPDENGACYLCSTGVNLKHTDVLILQQFVRSDGCMLPRRVTGLCKVQQKRVGIMVAMAQKAGLMPNLAPANSNKNPRKRFAKDKRNNTYFDERTIKQRYY